MASEIVKFELPEICDWIESKGGHLVLTIADVFTIADAWLLNTPPPGGEPPWTFIPTIQNVFGVADYWLGFDGDAGTGCTYYHPPGSGRVENLTFPAEIDPNTSFNAEYDCHNVGAIDTMWGHILQLLYDGTSIEVPGSKWEEEIIVDGTKHVITHFDGITSAFNGRVEVGHVPMGMNTLKRYVVDHVMDMGIDRRKKIWI